MMVKTGPMFIPHMPIVKNLICGITHCDIVPHYVTQYNTARSKKTSCLVPKHNFVH